MSSIAVKMPFAMHFLDTTTVKERGYVIDDSQREYDPLTQMSPLFLDGGETTPTTYSNVASTGVISSDTDEGADDKGTD